MIEYSITIKDENVKLTEKEISYEPLLLSRDNEQLVNRIQQAFNNFKNTSGNESPDVIIKATMVW